MKHLKIALQMDPPSQLQTRTDTSLALGLAAQQRGHLLFYYNPSSLTLRTPHATDSESGLESGPALRAVLHPLQFRENPDKTPAFECGPGEATQLRELDLILIRQDPPFDMAYGVNTHLLEFLKPDVVVANDPFWIRNAPEKLSVLQFPDLVPPTLITRDPEEARRFRAEIGAVIFKPLFGSGGAGILLFSPEDVNFESILEDWLQRSREPFVLQKFLPKVQLGDKRILLLDGEPVGALNRRPVRGTVRANLHAGGTTEKTELTDREQEICRRLKPFLQEKKLFFAGVDVIDGYMTELNITSPTCVQEMLRLSGVHVANLFWEKMEASWAQRWARP